MARGKYLLLLNNDTIFSENTLKELEQHSESMNGDFIVSSKLMNEDGSHQDSTYYFPSIIRLIGATFFLDQLFPSVNFFSKHNKLIRTASNPVEVDAVMGALMFIPKIRFSSIDVPFKTPLLRALVCYNRIRYTIASSRCRLITSPLLIPNFSSEQLMYSNFSPLLKIQDISVIRSKPIGFMIFFAINTLRRSVNVAFFDAVISIESPLDPDSLRTWT